MAAYYARLLLFSSGVGLVIGLAAEARAAARLNLARARAERRSPVGGSR